MFWGGGFDVLYACQDYDFDRQSGLHSVPRYFGIPRALWIARSFSCCNAVPANRPHRRVWPRKVGGMRRDAVALLLAYEHSLVSADDLSKLNAAFFTMNGVIAVVFFVFVAGDLLLH